MKQIAKAAALASLVGGCGVDSSAAIRAKTATQGGDSASSWSSSTAGPSHTDSGAPNSPGVQDSGGGGATPASTSSSTSSFVAPTCPPDGGLGGPTGPTPALAAGTWANISPPSVNFPGPGNDSVFTQGMALDPCNPYTIYVTVGGFDTSTFAAVPGGLFRSTDGGSTWTTLGNFQSPINIRVDPGNPKHMYLCDGVRGGTNGFWVTTDGGQTWAMPAGFQTASQAINDLDVYHIATDPSNFNHVLITFHWYWNGGSDFGFGTDNSGVLESSDGGNTWVTHNPNSGWAGTGGYDVFFLYDPALGIGDTNTWLFGTQGAGFWRTSDAGTTWTQVSTNNMQHGGGTIYYTATGTLYVSGTPNILRSSDNGMTWTTVAPSSGYSSVIGDGTTLYTGAYIGPTSYLTASESSGASWSNYGSQQFLNGPFEMAFDSTHRILYSASWNAGVWALKVTP
jgi:photosystem II stability/assembly factor-like uncharacterized protein